MEDMEFPAPSEGIVLTHFVVAADIAASQDFYAGVLGGVTVMEGGPTIVKLANSWSISAKYVGVQFSTEHPLSMLLQGHMLGLDMCGPNAVATVFASLHTKSVAATGFKTTSSRERLPLLQRGFSPLKGHVVVGCAS